MIKVIKKTIEPKQPVEVPKSVEAPKVHLTLLERKLKREAEDITDRKESELQDIRTKWGIGSETLPQDVVV